MDAVKTSCFPNAWKISPGTNDPSNFFATREAALTEIARRVKVVETEMRRVEEALRQRGVLL